MEFAVGQSQVRVVRVAFIEQAQLFTKQRLEWRPMRVIIERQLRGVLSFLHRLLRAFDQIGLNERILTVVTSLRQQGRDVLEYLTSACESVIGGSGSICLIPDSS
jgi:hypothetical protein